MWFWAKSLNPFPSLSYGTKIPTNLICVYVYTPFQCLPPNIICFHLPTYLCVYIYTHTKNNIPKRTMR